ncbi:45621_t:CDS:2 [Gigaspora margarita]|uniref:45621_t:CDS:1 n=1 Tax=Gigaspora margarita TaxID=4874 RepID=A0ABN7UJ59_GIGMA|nr:45621_t:CDS:2 [Gigaspora margarita]
MDIDRKTKQSEIREYEEVDQVSEAKNEKKHGSLVKSEKEVVQERVNQNRSEEKVQCCRREYAPKNKEELTKKRKEKESQHTYLGSAKTEGHRSALIVPKGVAVVSTNNSTLGKDLAPFSTNLNRGQNYQRIKLIEQKEDSKGENSEDSNIEKEINDK